MIKYGVKRISGNGGGGGSAGSQGEKNLKARYHQDGHGAAGDKMGPPWERVERHALRATTRAMHSGARGESAGGVRPVADAKAGRTTCPRTRMAFGECPGGRRVRSTRISRGDGGPAGGRETANPCPAAVPRWLKNAKDGLMWTFAWNMINEPRCNSTLLAPSPCTPPPRGSTRLWRSRKRQGGPWPVSFDIDALMFWLRRCF